MIPLHDDPTSNQMMDVSIDESMSYPFNVTRSSSQSVPQDVESSSEPADTTISLPPPDIADESIVSSPAEGDAPAMPLKLVSEDIQSSSSSPSPSVSPRGDAEALSIQPAMIEVEEKPRRLYDDGVRPLQTFFGASSSRISQPTSPTNSLLSPCGTSNGLDIPGRTSKADKRRSINPVLPGHPVQSLGSAGLATLQNPALRSDSPDSNRTSYYSPAVSPAPNDERSSPPGEVVSQMPPSSSRRNSRARISSTFVHINPPDTRDNDGINAVTMAAPPVPFPPRGNSLPIHQRELHGRDHHAPTTSTSLDVHRQQSDPSLLNVTALDEGPKTPRLSTEASLPSVKDDKLLRTPSPLLDPGDDDTEMTPQKAHTQVEIPALSSARFSKHTPGSTDILTSVSDSQPKVPMPRDYGIRNGLSFANGDAGTDDASLSQSATSPLSPSQSTPMIVHHSADSSDDIERSQSPFSPSQLNQSGHLPLNGNVRDGGLSQSASHPPTQLSSSARSLPGEPVPTSSSHPSGSSSLHLTAPTPPLLHPSPRKASTGGGSLAALGASMANGSAVSLTGSTKPNADHHDGSSLSSSSADLTMKKLREVLGQAKERGAGSVKLDPEFVENILKSVEGTKEAYSGLKGDMDHVKVDYFLSPNTDFDADTLFLAYKPSVYDWFYSRAGGVPEGSRCS